MAAIPDTPTPTPSPFADRLFSWLAPWTGRSACPFEEEVRSGRIRRVLCVQTAELPEALLTLPALTPLRARFPHAEIDFLCRSDTADAIAGHPELDRVLPCGCEGGRVSLFTYLRTLRELRRTEYDLAISFRASVRDIALFVYPTGARRRAAHTSGGGWWLLTERPERQSPRHRLEAAVDLVRHLGASDPPGQIRLPYETYHTEAARSFLLGAPRPWIGIHPGAERALLRWTQERFAAVARILHDETGGTIIITGTPGDRSVADHTGADLSRCAVFSPEHTSPVDLQALLAQLDVVITNDTLSAHLASGVNTPVVTVFGPSRPWETGHISPISVIVDANLPCRASCDGKACSNSVHHQCMMNVDVDDVLTAARQVLAVPRSESAVEEAA